MARRVHLHIGTMKSATTYIQRLCELHLDLLAEKGVLWPKGILRYAAVRDFFGRAEEQTDPADAWRTLADRINRHDGDVVLSNELMAALPSGRVGRLVEAFAPAEIRVVVTGRDPARVIPSAWQTTIRNGVKTFSWGEFSSNICSDPPSQAASPRGTEATPEGHLGTEGLNTWFWRQHDLGQVITRWSQFVPPERITLVTVPPPGADRDTVAVRFGNAIGVDLAGLSQPARGNSALGAYSTELVRRVSLAMPEADLAERKYGIKTGLAANALDSNDTVEPTFGLSVEQHAWVRDRAYRMVADINASGIRIEGDLAELIPTSGPPEGAVDPSSVPDSELLGTALQGIIGMVRQTAKLRTKCNDLRSEVASLQGERDKLRQQLDLQQETTD